MPTLPFAVASLSTQSWIIFAVAAFLALCAAISYLVANTLESQRRTRAAAAIIAADRANQHPSGQDASESGDGLPRSIRQLEWPDDAGRSGDQPEP